MENIINKEAKAEVIKILAANGIHEHALSTGWNGITVRWTGNQPNVFKSAVEVTFNWNNADLEVEIGHVSGSDFSKDDAQEFINRYNQIIAIVEPVEKFLKDYLEAYGYTD